MGCILGASLEYPYQNIYEVTSTPQPRADTGRFSSPLRMLKQTWPNEYVHSESQRQS